MKLLLCIPCILLTKLCLAVNIYLDINDPGDNPYYTRNISNISQLREITLKAVEDSGFVSVREGGTVIWSCYRSHAIAVILIEDRRTNIIKGVSLSFKYSNAVISKIFILRVEQSWMFVSRVDFNEFVSAVRRGITHPIGLPNPTVELDLNYRLGTNYIDVREKLDNYILDVIFIPKPKVNITCIIETGRILWRYNDKVPDKIVASVNKLNNELILAKLRFDSTLFGLYYIFLLKYNNEWIPVTKSIYKNIHYDVMIGSYNEKNAIIHQNNAYVDIRRAGNYAHYTTNADNNLSHTLFFESKPTSKYRISCVTDGNIEIYKCDPDEEIRTVRHYHDPESREPTWVEIYVYNPGRDTGLLFHYKYYNNIWQPGTYQDFDIYMRQGAQGEDEESSDGDGMQT